MTDPTGSTPASATNSAPRSEAMPAVWGSAVVTGHYAGHPGRLFDSSPPSIVALLEGLERWASREYVIQGERRITHGQFREAIARAATVLAELGVKPGDRVMLLSYNSPEFMLATWAAWWLGAQPVYANRWWSATELEHGLDLTKPAVVLTDDATLWTRAGIHDINVIAPAFDGGQAHQAHSARDLDDPALILFTSGSSGSPKAVVLSERSVIVNQHHLLLRSRRLPHDLDPSAEQSVTLVCTPLFHIGGVSNIVTNLLTGSRMVLTRGRFDPGEILQLIETEKVRTWGGVPTMAARVLDHPDLESYNLSTLRSWPLGGAPLAPTLLERMRTALPQLKERGLANTWGMTETGGFMTLATHADLERFPGTVGRPYPCVELRIANPDDSGSGEIQVRSPTVMLGYLGLDDGTVDDEGWLSTGDLGHVNEDGCLMLDGRSKDIVIRGGENIACVHVEQALASHQQVVEVAVFGIPHEELGEQLVAVVRQRRGRPLTEGELREHCRTTLAYFEIPSLWQIGDQPLPTLAGEKVDKKALRTAFVDRIDSTSVN